MGYRKYITENEPDIIANVIQSIKEVEGIIYQLWFDEDGMYRYKIRPERNVIRIGHLDTLTYIEIPRISILDKNVFITRPWLCQFKMAALHQKRFFYGFVLRK